MITNPNNINKGIFKFEIENPLQKNSDNRFPKNQTIKKTVEWYVNRKKSCDPFYIINLSNIQKQLETWKKYMNGIKPYYAIKCNGDQRLVEMIFKFGGGFDCASRTEIEEVQRLVPNAIKENMRDTVIFANPFKQVDDLELAKKLGVNRLVCDSVYELEKIKKYYPDSQIFIRIKTDDSSSKCQFSSKFGVAKNNVDSLFQKAKELSLDISGVSFHVGSGCQNPLSYKAAITTAGEIFTMGKVKYGMKMRVVDIGGGFPGIDDEKSEQLFKEIAQVVKTTFEEVFKPSETGITIIAEPGRFIATSPFTLVAQVIGKKKVGEVFYYYINESIYASFNCIVFDHYEFKMKHFKDETKVNYNSVIWGATCDSMDKLASDLKLPELDEGDWVYFENFGAYTTAGSAPFNGFQTKEFHYYWEEL